MALLAVTAAFGEPMTKESSNWSFPAAGTVTRGGGSGQASQPLAGPPKAAKKVVILAQKTRQTSCRFCGFGSVDELQSIHFPGRMDG